MVNLARLCIISNQVCLDIHVLLIINMLCGGNFPITNIVKLIYLNIVNPVSTRVRHKDMFAGISREVFPMIQLQLLAF